MTVIEVGDTVIAQHRKGGRKFQTKVRAIKVERGGIYYEVTDPKNGGTYLVSVERVTKVK
jgi:hypothetical protein